MQTSIREFAFADLQGFQRDSASFHPLFFTPARFRKLQDFRGEGDAARC
jgi:hypothetical protein